MARKKKKAARGTYKPPPPAKMAKGPYEVIRISIEPRMYQGEPQGSWQTSEILQDALNKLHKEGLELVSAVPVLGTDTTFSMTGSGHTYVASVQLILRRIG